MNNKDTIRFKVAPYALYDVLKALHLMNDNHVNELYEFGVTKEDNDLVVWVKKDYIPTSDACECSTSKRRTIDTSKTRRGIQKANIVG
jgi:hypothetical protein